MEEIKRCLKNDRFAALANVELLTVSPGHATAKMVLHPHHLNGLKTIQGGAIFTLADLPLPPPAIRTDGGRGPKREHHLHEGCHHRDPLG